MKPFRSWKYVRRPCGWGKTMEWRGSLNLFFLSWLFKKYLRLLQVKQIILLHGTVINFFFAFLSSNNTTVPLRWRWKKSAYFKGEVGKYLSQSNVMRKSCFTKEKNKSSCILISTSSDQSRFTFIFCHKNGVFFGPQHRLYCFFQNARLMISNFPSFFH